jgi:uncharacterized protein involved in outer membrane biogenesis
MLWVYYALGPMIATAIRILGPDIMGVAIQLDKVELTPFERSMVTHGLVVGNPKGYHTDHAISLAEMRVTVQLRSVFDDLIVIKHVRVEKPDIVYELGMGESNLDAIQRQVDTHVNEELGGGAQGSKDSSFPKKSHEKKVIIRELEIKDAKTHVSAKLLQGKNVTVPLPDMRIHDIGLKSDGATLGEVVKEVLGALTEGIVSAVGKLDLGEATGSAKEGAGSVLERIKHPFK